MSGGRDVIIVGIVGKNIEDRLENIENPERLRGLFGGDFPDAPAAEGADKHHEYVHRLEQVPNTYRPGVILCHGRELMGGCMWGGVRIRPFLRE